MSATAGILLLIQALEPTRIFDRAKALKLRVWAAIPDRSGRAFTVNQVAICFRAGGSSRTSTATCSGAGRWDGWRHADSAGKLGMKLGLPLRRKHLQRYLSAVLLHAVPLSASLPSPTTFMLLIDVHQSRSDSTEPPTRSEPMT
eukprot:6181009-Pleurochrysis_carterae.AAC.2